MIMILGEHAFSWERVQNIHQILNKVCDTLPKKKGEGEGEALNPTTHLGKTRMSEKERVTKRSLNFSLHVMTLARCITMCYLSLHNSGRRQLSPPDEETEAQRRLPLPLRPLKWQMAELGLNPKNI